MPPSRLHLALIALIAAGALAFRLTDLGARPMHADEAVHAHKLGILLETGQYTYDPADFHGPTLYYFSLPFLWATGTKSYADMSEAMCRVAPALFGAALTLTPLLLMDVLSPWGAVIAALLTAISPAMAYYSRYAIQEAMLVFFTAFALASAWRYSRAPRWGWALAAGAAVGLMQATKETSVLAYAAAGVGWLAMRPWKGSLRPWEKARSLRHLVGAAGLATLVTAAILTNFFRNPAAILDAARAYGHYVVRSGGAGLHDNPWDFYVRILVWFRNAPGPWWSEGLILALAAAGIAVALLARSAPPFMRFLAVYSVALLAIYSSIPYKTPWCALGFLHGFILLAGYGASDILRRIRVPLWRIALGAALMLGAAQLAAQAYRASFVFPADTRNPYVYAHTSTGLRKLENRMDALATVAPEGHDVRIHVIGPDYWPLPWTLRRFTHVGFWLEAPERPDSPVVLVADEALDEVAPRLRDEYHADYFGLRPHVLWLSFVRDDLWEAFIATRETPEAPFEAAPTDAASP